MSKKTADQTMINGVDTKGLKKTVGNIKTDRSLGKCRFRLSNEWIGGDENRGETSTFYAAGSENKHKKTFRFQAGEPALLMGKDEGANPVEFLLRPRLLPFKRADSSSFPLGARKNKGQYWTNIASLFSHALVRAPREKIISNMPRSKVAIWV